MKLLVAGFDVENLPLAVVEGHGTGFSIQIAGGCNQGKLVGFHHVFCIGEQEVAVCLQMDSSIIFQEVSVAFHEISGRKSFSRHLHLGVAECQPYLIYFVRSKETGDELDACP